MDFSPITDLSGSDILHQYFPIDFSPDMKLSEDDLKFLNNSTQFSNKFYSQFFENFPTQHTETHIDSMNQSSSENSPSDSYQSMESTHDFSSQFNSPMISKNENFIQQQGIISSLPNVPNLTLASQPFLPSQQRMGLDLIPVRACRPPDEEAGSLRAEQNVANFTTATLLVPYNAAISRESITTNTSPLGSSPLLSSPLENTYSPSSNDSTPYMAPSSAPGWHRNVNLGLESGINTINTRENMNQKTPKGGSKTCPICFKSITRDLSRHLRIHEPVSRFRCVFPRDTCNHKTGQFNRPYDYKKHLLNSHFVFDDSSIRKLHNLNEKLHFKGTCLCGMKFTAADWLDSHILTPNCTYLLLHELPIRK